MNNIFMLRDDVHLTCIRSTLIAKDEKFHIIERPWLNNQNNISCIPAGEYYARFLKQSISGKYKNIYHLYNVPNRVGILIHNGNLASQSQGCLIIGKRRGTVARQPAVLNSMTALYEFVELMNYEDFKLTIIGDQREAA